MGEGRTGGAEVSRTEHRHAITAAGAVQLWPKAADRADYCITNALATSNSIKGVKISRTRNGVRVELIEPFLASKHRITRIWQRFWVAEPWIYSTNRMVFRPPKMAPKGKVGDANTIETIRHFLSYPGLNPARIDCCLVSSFVPCEIPLRGWL